MTVAFLQCTQPNKCTYTQTTLCKLKAEVSMIAHSLKDETSVSCLCDLYMQSWVDCSLCWINSANNNPTTHSTTLHGICIDQMKAKCPTGCTAIVHPNTEASSKSIPWALLWSSRLRCVQSWSWRVRLKVVSNLVQPWHIWLLFAPHFSVVVSFMSCGGNSPWMWQNLGKVRSFNWLH